MMRSRVRSMLESPTVVSMALSGSAAAVAGLTSLLAARWMGAEERGLYALLITGSGFLLLLCSAGVVNTANLFIADPNHNLSVRGYARLALRLLLAVAVVLVPASGLVVLVYAESPTWSLYLLFAGYCLLALLAAFYRTGLHGWARHRLAFGVEVASGAVVLVGAVMFHLRGNLTVMQLIAIGTIAFAFQALIASIAFRSAARPPQGGPGEMTLRRLLTLSLPTLGFTVGGWIAARGDRLVLGLVSDNAQVGIYSTVATMAEVPWLVAATMATIFGTRLAASQDATLVSRFRTRAVLGTAVAWMLMAPLALWILTSFLGPEFSDGIPALVVMCPAALLLASSQIDLAACLALGDRAAASRVGLVGAGVMVFTAAVMGGPWGATGCAIASLITYGTMAVLAERASTRNVARLAAPQSRTPSEVAHD